MSLAIYVLLPPELYTTLCIIITVQNNSNVFRSFKRIIYMHDYIFKISNVLQFRLGCDTECSENVAKHNTDHL